jgi:hypothetical protein
MLVLLPLFLFRANRCAKAWWIWAPVAVSAGAGTAIICLLSDSEGVLAQAASVFVVGLAALWLLMPALGSRYRLLAFLKALVAVAAFSELAFLPTLLAENQSWLDFRPYLAAVLALGSLAVASALTLDGLSVRRRFGRVRCVCWLGVWTLVVWTAIATPFVVIASLTSNIEWGASVLAILCLSALTLALLLPFVLLSFFQLFYRARFFEYFKVPQADVAVGSAVPPRVPQVEQIKAPTTPFGAGP